MDRFQRLMDVITYKGLDQDIVRLEREVDQTLLEEGREEAARVLGRGRYAIEFANNRHLRGVCCRYARRLGQMGFDDESVRSEAYVVLEIFEQVLRASSLMLSTEGYFTVSAGEFEKRAPGES